MWRSRASALILHTYIRRRFSIYSPSKILALIPPSPTPPSQWTCLISADFLNHRCFSSASESATEVDEASDTLSDFREASGSSVELEESDASPVAFRDGDAGSDSSGDSFSSSKDEDEIGAGGESGHMWEESFDGVDPIKVGEEAVGQVPEVDADQVESVLSVLQSSLPDEIGSSLDRIGELCLSEEFVVRVFQDADVSGENLVSFFRWVMRKEESVKSARVLDLLVHKVSASDELSKMEAYKLWDLIKEMGNVEGILNTEMLNQLIYVFWKLEKAKAALEVFNKFDDFGYASDGNSYYFTIEALGKRSMIDAAWSVCEKMLNSGRLPDGEKIGKIITLFCRGKKAKEAHLVYVVAKDNKIHLGRDAFDFMINGLSRKDETVRLALEILKDYPHDSLKRANMTFSSVVKGLTRIKDVQAAKTLLLRMVDSGPPPGNSTFNYVITGLCKEGEVEEALAFIKIMESRGLRPDVYTYTVIMSGFAKGGLMDEAFKIFCEAKKKHKILTPVTYHILIRGYCKMEEYEKALECLKDMKENGVQPNSDEYDKLIKTFCLKALDWRKAEKLLEEMKDNGIYLKGATRSLVAAVKALEEEIASGENEVES